MQLIADVKRNGWTPEAKASLSDMWIAGALTQDEMAELMNVSRNAVHAQAKRMELPMKPAREAKPCPIKARLDLIAPERRSAGPDPLPAGHWISAGAIRL